MRLRTAPVFLSLAAALTAAVSCGKESSLPSLDEYWIEVSVCDGTVRDAIILTYPYALVSFSGPVGNGGGTVAEAEFIVKDSSSGETFSVNKEITGEGTITVPLIGAKMSGGSRYYTKASVVRTVDRTVLYERNDLSVVFQSKDVAIRDAYILTESSRQALIEGEPFTLKEGDKGRVVISMEGDESFDSLNLTSTPSSLMQFGTPSSDELKQNIFTVPFEAIASGEGVLTFCATISGRKHNFIFGFIVTPSSTPPGPGPSGEKAVFSVSGPSVAFAGVEAAIRLRKESGDSEHVSYDVALFLDGKPCGSSIRTGGNTSSEKKLHEWVSFEGDVTMVIGLSEPLDGGAHTLTARLRPSGATTDLSASEGDYSEASASFMASSLSFSWESVYGDLGTVLEGKRLLSSKGSAEYRLALSYDCDASLLSEVNAVVSGSGKDLREEKALSSYILSYQSRGTRRIDITVKTKASEEYKFQTEVRCEDEYGCAVKCDGSTISAVVSGPSQTAEATVSYHIDGGIIAVIPYTEAIELGGGYYEVGKYEYTDLQWVEKSFEQKKGTAFGEKVLQSGWIQTAMSWAKSKLSDIKVTPGKASRWKNQGGKMVKEYYTPKPYLLVKLYIKAIVTEASQADYIVLSYDFENLKAYLDRNGVELLVYRK